MSVGPDKQSTEIFLFGAPSFANGGTKGPTLSALLPSPSPPPSSAVTITGPGGLTFNLTFDTSVNSAPAGFTTTVENVARGFSNALRSTATINLNVGWGEVGGNALPSNGLGASYFYLSGPYTYSQIVNALSAHATSSDDSAALTSLSGSDPTNGGHLVLTTAQAETLGLLSYSGNDGSIGFGSGFAYTFAPLDRAVGGAYDFIGTAVHEIAEVLGRVAFLGSTVGSITNAYSLQDLFRYSALNTRDLGAGGYFSPDGGKTNLNKFNTGGGDAGDWAGSAGNDSFNAFASSGVENIVTGADIRTMDTIGWNLVTPFANSPSPDGSILTLGQAGTLTTNDGIWRFDSTVTPTGNLIMVNNQSAQEGAGTELEVANGGQMFVQNNTGQWFAWTGTSWAVSSGPTAQIITSALSSQSVPAGPAADFNTAMSNLAVSDLPAPEQAGQSPDFAVPLVSDALLDFGSADHPLLVTDSTQPIPNVGMLFKVPVVKNGHC